MASLGGLRPYPFQTTGRNASARSARTELNWVRKFAGGAKLDTKVSVAGTHNQSASQKYGYQAKSAPLLLDEVNGSEGRDRGYAFTGKYSMPLGAGHALMAGWEARMNQRSEENTYRQSTIPDQGLIDFDDTSIARVRRYAGFAQDEWNVTPAWSVYGGLRWEGSQTDVRGNSFEPSRSSSGVWSPLFQTLYKLPGGKGDQLRLALTRTYKAPSGSQLITSRIAGINNSKTNPYFTGNPDLKPEIALGFDTSYEHYWAEGAMVSASASMREIDGYTNYVTSQDPAGRWVVRPENNGKAHTRGIELEAKFPLKAVLAKAPEVDLRANLSRNWSSVDVVPGPYNYLANQTRMSATVGADYKAGKLSTGVSMSYMEGGPKRTSVTLLQVTPALVRADVYALWKFDSKNQVRVAVNNLLQKDYLSEQLYTDVAGSTRERSVYPATVNFRLSLEYKY